MQWTDATLTLTTPSHTIVFNGAAPGYWNDPAQCAGLDQAPIRANRDPRPQTAGAILRPSFYDARAITISGLLSAGSLAARQTLEDDLVAALDEILNVDGTLSWAAAGKSLTVRCDIPAAFSGAFMKTYLFGLVAANPTIA